MFFIFFLFWIVLNGHITGEIVIFGLVISTILTGFSWKFMGNSAAAEVRRLRRFPYLIAWFVMLVIEMVISANGMLQFLFDAQKTPEPAIIHFCSGLREEKSRMLLANAITMTPGTLTVALTGDDFYIHCYDKSFGEGIGESGFVTLLKQMEDSYES